MVKIYLIIIVENGFEGTYHRAFKDEASAIEVLRHLIDVVGLSDCYILPVDLAN